MSALARNRALFFAAIVVGGVGAVFSPNFVDRSAFWIFGFFAMASACGWLAGRSTVQDEWAEEAAGYLNERIAVEVQRDELAQLLDAARADVADLLADRYEPDHGDCPIRALLTELVDDGPLSIEAHNRARAGLAPAPDTHREG